MITAIYDCFAAGFDSLMPVELLMLLQRIETGISTRNDIQWDAELTFDALATYSLMSTSPGLGGLAAKVGKIVIIFGRLATPQSSISLLHLRLESAF